MARWERLAVVGAILAVAGCGGSSGAPPPPPEPPPVPGAPAGEAEREGTTVEVRMENIQYMPREVSVPVGGTVRWKNTDTPPHTVTSESGGFDSGQLQPGETYEHRFERPGKVDYLCTIHPGQTGVVNVR